MIALKPVENSSQVAAAGYDEAQRVLSVKFKSGRHRFDYRDVPPNVAMAFDEAPSKGKFIATHVKGKFDFEKVDTEPLNTTTLEGSTDQ